MNGLIPTLIAVLLAEIGGRSQVALRLPRYGWGDRVLAMTVALAAVGGSIVAPTMTDRARALLLGLALLAAAWGQRGNVDPDGSTTPSGFYAILAFMWRSNVAFLTFAFAAWKGGPGGAMFGALFGFLGAIAISTFALPGILARLRIGAAVVLATTGLYSALWALRLL